MSPTAILDLEAQKSALENKLAVEQAKQIKPLKYEDVKNYIMYFAHKKYEKGEEKNEFFNSFINMVILFDDKVIIIYNTNKTETRELKISEQKQIIRNLLEKDSENKKNSLEPKKFKRVSPGGGRETLKNHFFAPVCRDMPPICIPDSAGEISLLRLGINLG